MAIEKSVTWARAQEIAAPILTDVKVNDSGEMIFIAHDLSEINIGVVAELPWPTVPALVTLSSFDTVPTEVVVPEWYRALYDNKVLANPSSLPTADGADLAWSPDGIYLAIVASASPYLYVYKRRGDTLTKLPDPAVLPGGLVNAVAWSPDGQYLSIGLDVAPYIKTYKRAGDTLTPIANPASLPTSSVKDVDWSPDGLYFGAATSGVESLIVYGMSSGVPVKAFSALSATTGTGRRLAWASNNKFITMAHESAPYVTTYTHAPGDDVFSELPAPGVIPSGIGIGVDWSEDSQYLVVVHEITPFITIYKRDGVTLNPLSGLVDPLTDPVTDAAWSRDDRYLAVSLDSSPYLVHYRFEDDAFVGMPAMTSPAGSPSRIEWSPGGQYLTLVHATTPYLTNYKSSMMQPKSVAVHALIIP